MFEEPTVPRTKQARPEDLLLAGAASLGCSLTPSQVDQFMVYLDSLKEWNRTINLTSITEDEEVIEKHFLDSLAGLNAIRRHSKGTLLDIGTGAGFPGIPLKIALPELNLTLVEASPKKTAFLHFLSGRLKLSNLTILNQKIEALPKTGSGYSLIVVRALAKVEAVLEKTHHLLLPTGRLILYQGGRINVEKIQGMQGWIETLVYELPRSKIHRRLEIFEPTLRNGREEETRS